MAVKDQILTLLLESRGEAISGEEMAEQFQVTRSAVWKAIRSLQKDGYQIIGVQNKGYRLIKESGEVSRQSIQQYLACEEEIDFQIFAELESTNAKLKDLENHHAKEWTVVVADRQLSGRGKWGQSFYSPKKTGIYMSVLLRPHCELSKIQPMKRNAAHAVSYAVQKATGENIEIRNENDIYLYHKKIGGILSEASVCLETGITQSLIIGIGIHVFEPIDGFPKEIKQATTSIFHSGESDYEIRNRIVADILNYLTKSYHILLKEEGKHE